ncbi:MAG: hypothetical protein VZT48_11565 [Bulleidia sp.]|nr:hypothetical protein [Bulleidia sp.]
MSSECLVQERQGLFIIKSIIPQSCATSHIEFARFTGKIMVDERKQKYKTDPEEAGNDT